ncbi:c-type cytochrome [Blastomonas fulva]|uniref:c-type cytochrome n=1 Tax=Blastomonas fulva TaxID=1550728 RepID=UPI003D26E377
MACSERYAPGIGVPGAAFVLMALLGTIALVSQVSADETAEGRALYVEHCAACHGVNLEGAPDWQSRGPDGRFPAPPHDETGHTWHHGDAMLFDYTRRGGQAFLDDLGVRFDSGMPAFDDILSDAEIEAILAYIRSTWPERIRAFQAERTAAEGAD